MASPNTWPVSDSGDFTPDSTSAAREAKSTRRPSRLQSQTGAASGSNPSGSGPLINSASFDCILRTSCCPGFGAGIFIAINPRVNPRGPR